MRLLTLHQGLLGIDPNHTPTEYHVTPRQRELYEQYPQFHGYAQNKQDPDLFLGTLILALAQTDHRKSRNVLLFVPKPLRPWVVKQIEGVFRYAVRCRKGDTANLQILKEAFGQISLSHQFLQIPKEPDHWAAYGIDRAPVIPSWLTKKLTDG